jgi:hypothetical protein
VGADEVEQPLRVFALEDRVEEQRVGFVVDTLGGGYVRLAIRQREQAVEIQEQPDLAAVSALAEKLNGRAVRQQQVVGGLISLRIIADPGGVDSGPIAEEGCHPRFVERRPELDPVGQALENETGVLCKAPDRFPVRPSALVLQFLGQIPMIQGCLGLDAGPEQLIHQAVVKIETFDVGLAPALRHHAAPRNRKTIKGITELPDEGHVFRHAMVMIAGRLGVLSAQDVVRRPHEAVPDALPAAILVPATLDLIGRGGNAPGEICRKF